MTPPPPALSIPTVGRAPRSLTAPEQGLIERVADVLIPALGEDIPAASAEPGFRDQLIIALDARSDAFEEIVGALADLSDVSAAGLFGRLQLLDEQRPSAFQALSTVVAGAWLLTPGTRARIGYRGPRSDRAGLEDAADELATGVLEPVMDRYPPDSPRWVR